MIKRPWQLSIAILQAIQMDDVEAAEKILNMGYDVDSIVMQGKSAVSICIERKATKIAKLLIRRGCSLSFKNQLGESPLHLAVHLSDYALIKLLLENRADVTSINASGQTPLHIACRRKSLEIVKLLIEKSTTSSLNKPDLDGVTPLMLACKHSCPAIIKLLLAKGCSVHVSDKQGNGPVLNVTYNTAEHAMHVLPMLLDAGARINQRNKYGETALLRAVAQSCLIQEVRNVTKSDTCVKHSYTNLCMLLINRGSDVNAVNKLGQTPLHLAVSSNHELLVRKLVLSGSDINCQDNMYFVPLFYACRNGNQRLVNLLINSGANLRAQNWEDYLTMFKNEEIILLLSYLVYKSKECLTLKNLCNITIRRNLKNVEENALQLPLPPSLIKHIQLKD